ncbi:MAG TPA: threonine ammonia-lyase IlvA [Bacteroidia bacterium]|jgi:threonine dehydratase|nr:threonine ammonia-lyase IlvA [Bacteroidia bacterium]
MITAEHIDKAAERLSEVVVLTPLQYNVQLSEEFGCQVYLKREDLQLVRSYKLRGAYNKISSLHAEEQLRGVVCASAGNHAQGVAYACQKLNIQGTIFMPVTTPSQKVNQVRLFGKDKVNVILTGDTFDDAQVQAVQYGKLHKACFVHPFDDEKVIEGQGTVAQEIVDDAKFRIDYLLVPVGGGGLAAGVSTYFSARSPHTKIIGIEPEGAASMQVSMSNGCNTELQQIDKFVDGAAVKRVGDLTFDICNKLLSQMVLVPEGKVCTTILQLYNQQAIVVEPAGALTVAALGLLKEQLKGKNVVCVLSGSNNDILRTAEIKERSLQYEGLKHYFVIRFPQRAGALKEFVGSVLGPGDDIVHFEYMKKNNRENGPALIGIELKEPHDLPPLRERLAELGFQYEYLNGNDNLLQFLI